MKSKLPIKQPPAWYLILRYKFLPAIAEKRKKNKERKKKKIAWKQFAENSPTITQFK